MRELSQAWDWLAALHDSEELSPPNWPIFCLELQAMGGCDIIRNRTLDLPVMTRALYCCAAREQRALFLQCKCDNVYMSHAGDVTHGAKHTGISRINSTAKYKVP